MIKKTILLIIVLGILSSFSVSAEVLKLKNLLDRVDEENPDMRSAKFLLENSRIDVKITQNDLIPELSLSYRHSEDKSRTGAETDSGIYSLTFSQTYPGFFKITDCLIDIKKLQYKKAEKEFTERRNTILKRGLDFYFKIIKAQNEIKVHEENLFLINELLNVAKINEQAGFGLYSDVLRVEAEKINIQLQLIQAQNNLDNLVLEFKAFMNLKSVEKIIFPEKYKYKAYTELDIEKIEIDKLPSIELVKKDMDVLGKSLKIANYAKLPSVNFSLSSVKTDNASAPAIKTGADKEYSLSLTLSQKLYDSGTTILMLKQAQKMYEAAKINYDYRLVLKKAEIEKNISKYGENIKRIEGIEKSSEYVRENMRLVTERFKQGDAGIVELIDAQVLISNTKLREITAYYDERIGLADYFININYPEGLWRLADED
ncbi:MAG: TolC family protein [Candidatus Muiribacteriota bacterium]